jgi:alpha,alpha-trehalase
MVPGEIELMHTVTTDIVPVDLNVLLWEYEDSLARWIAKYQDTEPAKAESFKEKAQTRKDLIHRYMWNEESGYFFDYNHKHLTPSSCWSIAGMFPMAYGVATEDQAHKIHANFTSKFLQPGGALTTWNESLAHSGQQWDCPNGWAPMQYISFIGLLNYGLQDTAFHLRARWMQTVESVFQKTGSVLEKYDVLDWNKQSCGGEYECQEGFGWTNGVHLALADLEHWRELCRKQTSGGKSNNKEELKEEQDGDIRGIASMMYDLRV